MNRVELSNKDIIAGLKSVDKRKILEYLYTTYASKVKSFVVRNGGTKDDGEDMFQEVVMIFYQKVIANQLTEEDCNVGGFIIGVSKNKWCSAIKKDVTRKNYHKLSSKETDKSYSTMSSVLSVERERIVNDVLALIGEDCKQLIRMVVYENRALKEIAQIMGFSSEDVAKTKHYRCKKKLSAQLRENKAFKAMLVEND